jgi:hypothetical protein
VCSSDLERKAAAGHVTTWPLPRGRFFIAWGAEVVKRRAPPRGRIDE